MKVRVSVNMASRYFGSSAQKNSHRTPPSEEIRTKEQFPTTEQSLFTEQNLFAEQVLFYKNLS